MKKAAALRAHTVRRCQERLGFQPDQDWLDGLAKAVRHRVERRPETDHEFSIEKGGRRAPRCVVRITYENRMVRLVWERATNRIVTILPTDGYRKKK